MIFFLRNKLNAVLNSVFLLLEAHFFLVYNGVKIPCSVHL
jgi:hypothetical protein